MDLIYVKGKSNISELIMTVLVPVLLGILSFLLVKNHTGVYKEFAQAVMLPPIVIIPIIWIVVLIFMGLASYRMKLAYPASASHVYYAASLLVGFVWNVLLLRFEKLNVAFVTIIIYIFFLVLTFFEFEKTDKKSGYFMLPALVWSVALALVNFLMCRSFGNF